MCNVDHSRAPQNLRRRPFPLLPPNLGGSCPYIPGPSKRVAMVLASSIAPAFSTDRHAGLFRTRLAAHVPNATPAPSADPPAFGPQVRARTRTERGVVVLKVAGRLGAVIEDLDWAIQLALADGPRGVVCELVTNSTFHAGTDIALSVAWSRGALRLTVQDNSPEPPRQRFPQFDQHGRARSAVDGLNRAVGVLPTANGGKVVWAVLNAARPTP